MPAESEAARRLAEETEKLRILVRHSAYTEQFKYGYDCAMRDMLSAIRALLEPAHDEEKPNG